jgi:hypothetical protein
VISSINGTGTSGYPYEKEKIPKALPYAKGQTVVSRR